MNYLTKHAWNRKITQSSLLCAFLLISFLGVSQQFPSKFLSLEDGIPQNLYRVVQDADGYMWILSDEGIARYDGLEFKFIGIEDGLPDDDVYNFIPDRQGRNWLLNDSNILCYLRSDSIRSLSIPSVGRPYVIKKDSLHTDILSDGTVIKITEKDSIVKKTIFEYIYKQIFEDTASNSAIDYEAALKSDSLGNFLLQGRNKYSHFSIDHLESFYKSKNSFDQLTKELLVDSMMLSESQQAVFQECIFSNTLQFFTNGYLFVFDRDFQLQRRLQFENPKNRSIKTALEDTNGDYWNISKDGIFIIDKNFITNNIRWLPSTQNMNILNIEKYNDNILIHSADNNIYRYKVDENNESPIRNIYTKSDARSGHSITQIVLTGDRLFYVYPRRILEYIDLSDKSKNPQRVKEDESIIASIPGTKKGLSFPYDSILLYATKTHVAQIDLISGEQKQLYRGYSVAVDFIDDNYFIATDDSLIIKRLYEKDHSLGIPNLSSVFAISNAFCLATTKLQQSFLCNPDSSKKIDELDEKKIRKLFFAENHLWIVYDKGFIKSNFTSTGDLELIQDFRLAEVLKVNQVNDLIIFDSLATVATDKGLFQFNYRAFKLLPDRFPTLIEKIVTGERSLPFQATIELPYDERNITIHCSALSFKDKKPVQYTYVMNGVEEDRTTSNSNQIRYTNLSPGLYNFEVYATNEFGSTSNRVKLQVKIKKPWWRTWIFYFFAILLLCSGVFFITIRRVNQIREKSRLEQKFAELELNALQSQMNPHFVFNAMSSMQNLIQQKDFVRSDLYLAKFSRLMRMYLESSKQKYISIKDELDIIETYFTLEKLRFREKISLKIDNKLPLDRLQAKIPSSLLQPFVENSINHGLFHKDGPGTVIVRFYELTNSIIIEIEDDGVGREASAQINKGILKPKSRALGIIDDKIKAIKKMDNYQIEYAITDLFDSLDKSKGTKVTIRINQKPI